MPDKWLWTPEQDALVRSMAEAGLGTQAMADQLGCSRQFALRRAKELGVMQPRHVASPRPTRSKHYATPPYPRGKEPLPAGHWHTWGLLTHGTILEGSPYG